MARPITFDPDAAVDRAVDLFWTRGYRALSVDDIAIALPSAGDFPVEVDMAMSATANAVSVVVGIAQPCASGPDGTSAR